MAVAVGRALLSGTLALAAPRTHPDSKMMAMAAAMAVAMTQYA
jgi:hypothetical protein